jgi:hypothetical protein
MSEDNRDHAFLENVKATLDSSAEHLDTRILRRLKAARTRALEAGKRRGGLWHWLRFPAAGLATALVGVLIVVLFFHRPTVLQPDNNVEYIEILASKDSLDLYVDLDFYIWLAEEADHVG